LWAIVTTGIVYFFTNYSVFDMCSCLAFHE
jgi:hypothetical protein